MAEAAVVQDDDKFLDKVRKHYKLCLEADRDNRDRAREALAFRNLEQWDVKVKNDRENDPEGARPCLVVDKLNQHVQQVVNDERQNRPQIKVRPVDDKGDPEVAKIYDGIIRHIQDASHADIAYDTGFEQAVDGGFGYWRILTEYCDPYSFEQDLRIRRLRNRFAVYLDPERQEPDGSDAKYGFILYKLSKEKFKAEYGKEADESLEAFDFETGREFAEWYGEDWVLVAEYYWIEQKKTKIVMLADAEGTVMTEEEYEKLTPPQGLTKPAIQAERETKIPKVRWRTVTGNKVLKTNEWPGYHLPIVEVVGNELDIEGKVHRSGMIRTAMDAQRVDNYATSAFIEQVALAPRAPWIAAAGQLEGYENDWRTANRRSLSVLPYKPITIEGTVVAPPMRQPPPGVPIGWEAVLLQAEHNIQAAMGRYDASLGEESNEKSGKAIIARQRKGDIGSFHFSDNLARSLRHTGRILVDVIPKFYDTKRIARIVGEDGSHSTVTVDPDLKNEMGEAIPYAEMPGANGKIEKIYNLNVGKYDVTVTTGPGYATKRLEAAEFLGQMATAAKDPITVQVLTYLAIKNNDWAGAEEATEMLKKTLPPGIVPESDEDEQEPMVMTPGGPVPASQAGELMAQMAQQLEMAAEEVKAAGDVKGDLAKLEKMKADIQRQADQVAAREAMMSLKEQLAQKSMEAEEARSEAERTKIVADMKMLVNDAVTRLEGMKQEAQEAKEGEDAEKTAQENAKNEQKNAEITAMQQELLEKLAEVLPILAAPRKTTIELDEEGNPIGAMSEVVA